MDRLMKKYIILILRLLARRIFFYNLQCGKYRLIIAKKNTNKYIKKYKKDEAERWHDAWHEQRIASGRNYSYGYDEGYSDALAGMERRTAKRNFKK